MFHRGWFQVAVRNTGLREAICRVLMQYGTARIAQEDAAALPSRTDCAKYAGLVTEWTPTVGEWLLELRRSAPCLPVLLFVDRAQLALTVHLQAASVEVALTPVDVAQLTSFAQRALASCFLPSERVARMVSFLAHSRGLTAREVQLLSYCLADEPRARVRRRLGISENTLKTQVKALLRKCGERNVDALAKNVLRAALLESVPRHNVVESIAPWYPAQQGAA